MTNRKKYAQPEVAVTVLEPEMMLAGSGDSGAKTVEIGGDTEESASPQIEKCAWDD